MIINLPGEAWVPVYQAHIYNHPYEVSNMGRIQNARTGKLLVPMPNDRGQCYVSLYYAKHKAYGRLVARLILLSFVGPDAKRPLARHRNGVAGDNRLTNLLWATPQEIADARDWEFKHSNKGERNGRLKYSWGQVERVRDLYEQGLSPKELMAMFPEINKSAIRTWLYRPGAWNLKQKECRALSKQRKKLIGAVNDLSTIQAT